MPGALSSSRKMHPVWQQCYSAGNFPSPNDIRRVTQAGMHNFLVETGALAHVPSTQLPSR